MTVSEILCSVNTPCLRIEFYWQWWEVGDWKIDLNNVPADSHLRPSSGTYQWGVFSKTLWQSYEFHPDRDPFQRLLALTWCIQSLQLCPQSHERAYSCRSEQSTNNWWQYATITVPCIQGIPGPCRAALPGYHAWRLSLRVYRHSRRLYRRLKLWLVNHGWKRYRIFYAQIWVQNTRGSAWK